MCGAVLSGYITELIGRKKAMIFVNIPHIFAWVILYHSTELIHVFIAICLLGFGVGLMESPVVAYTGEIWLENNPDPE